jgi:cytochrome P450 family 6
MGVGNLFLVIAALTFIALTYVRRKFAFWADRHVEHFPPSFPFGNIKGAGSTHALHEIFQTFYKKMKSSVKNGFMGFYISISPAVLALDLDFVKNVLVRDFQHFHDRGIYYNERDDPLTAHLFAIDGQKWKVLRNKLSPTFTSGKMKMMFPMIVKIAEEFKSTMAEEVKRGADFEMQELLARFTTDVIGTCAFGLDCNSLKDPDAEFRRYGKRIFSEENFMKQIFCTQFKGLARCLRTKIVPPEVTTFFTNAVRETIAFRETNNIKRNDFLDLMIEMKNSEDSNNSLTFAEIAAQAFVFFLAGFETSSTVMTYTLYELAQNQKLQQKARDCVQEVLKKHGGVMDYDSMMEMTYVNQCLNGEFLSKRHWHLEIFHILF